MTPGITSVSGGAVQPPPPPEDSLQGGMGALGGMGGMSMGGMGMGVGMPMHGLPDKSSSSSHNKEPPPVLEPSTPKVSMPLS